MGQSKMDIPEKQATYGTQDEDKQNKNTTQYVLDTTICNNKINKTNNRLSHQTIDHEVCIKSTRCIVSFSSYTLYIVI